LIALLALISLLALIQGSVLGNNKSNAERAVCAENLRRLTLAWQMYADDHAGALMGNPGVQGSLKSWVKGWLDFTTSTDNTNTLYLTNTQHALMGLYVTSASLFRCPSDLSAISRAAGSVLRVRSYSMNGWVGQGAVGWNLAPFQVMQKNSQISQPDGTFVLIEEHPDSINDPLLLVDMAGSGSRATIVDYPAAFHSGAANVAKADGRVEFWQWVDPRTMPPMRYGGLLPLNVPSPNNLDVARLQQATTYRN